MKSIDKIVIYNYQSFCIFIRTMCKNSLFILILCFLILNIHCESEIKLKSVTVEDFSIFIDSTNYITDAEKFGWSFIQKDVFNFDVIQSVSWKSPNGESIKNFNLPVTQISYNDALAYCKWAGVKLPTYDQYWKAVANDKRPVISESKSIQEINSVNIVGNVWDLTTTENINGEIRLAGGSYLCSPKTCHGTQRERKLFVDKETANTHISLAVYKP
jgi:formylglycine-generating enzyme required for sulfatase activity